MFEFLSFNCATIGKTWVIAKLAYIFVLHIWSSLIIPRSWLTKMYINRSH